MTTDLPSPPGGGDDPSQRLAAYAFDLPPDLVAQVPAPDRSASRLMVLPRVGALALEHGHMAELPARLRGDELVVLNDTRVVPARLRGRKASGGRVELLVVAAVPGAPGLVEAMGRASKPLRPGARVLLDRPARAAGPGPAAEVVVEGPLGDGHVAVRLPSEAGDLWGFLEAWGEVPLPPYIHREEGPTAEDVARYQTVFARAPGSVAAPTAGLHFTPALLDAVRARGCETAFVTLHVGPGTFAPVRADRLADHRMHAERYAVPEATADAFARARADGRPVLAVGTTVARTLEAVAAAHGGRLAPGEGATDLFIVPGWRFRAVDQLLTNFHLPGSTLLVLVSALAGRERVLAAYAEAVRRRYRFFSYGDGMLIR